MSAPGDQWFTSINNIEVRTRLEGRIVTILKASRQDSDVGQRELAVRIGWTRNMIANLETGRRSVQFVDFVMISKSLGMLRRILQW
jgi:transcriptional regulator with XRE-family HTH domain